MNHIYSTIIRKFPYTLLIQLLHYSDFYLVKGLKIEIEEFLLENINFENCFEILTLLFSYSIQGFLFFY
jgi:ABC-type arginine transport system permease subunit